MQSIADYKVLNDSSVYIGSNQDHTLTFTLGGAIVQATHAQRPYLLIEETLGGALPGTLSISINGQPINTRNGNAYAPLSDGLTATYLALFDGSLLTIGDNSLTFDVATTTNTNWTLGAVILNFQRQL